MNGTRIRDNTVVVGVSDYDQGSPLPTDSTKVRTSRLARDAPQSAIGVISLDGLQGKPMALLSENWKAGELAR